ncbi:MAG: response regulator [Deltaproteobacteria bacterium]|nr:response regulator [Deltaproteobacteria bacterium]
MARANVLLVDDEAPFVEALTRRLSKRELDITPAHDGAQALEKLEQSRIFEVVILDVKMPGMDGIETLREIKTAHPLIEVIMLTGHATIESAIEGMKLGAFDYLMKPCDIDELVAKVEQAAARKQMQEEKITLARIKEIAARRD